MSIEEVLEDVKRHLDYVEATKQMSIRDNQIKKMYEEIDRLNNDIKILLKENENKEKVIKAQDNIIKKAREYIIYWHYRNDFRINSFTTGVKEELLEILEGSDK